MADLAISRGLLIVMAVQADLHGRTSRHTRLDMRRIKMAGGAVLAISLRTFRVKEFDPEGRRPLLHLLERVAANTILITRLAGARFLVRSSKEIDIRFADARRSFEIQFVDKIMGGVTIAAVGAFMRGRFPSTDGLRIDVARRAKPVG